MTLSPWSGLVAVQFPEAGAEAERGELEAAVRRHPPRPLQLGHQPPAQRETLGHLPAPELLLQVLPHPVNLRAEERVNQTNVFAESLSVLSNVTATR